MVREPKESKSKKVQDYLIALIFILVTIFLIATFAYFQWYPNADSILEKILIPIIPSAIVVTGSYPILYLFFIRYGIQIPSSSETNPNNIDSKIAQIMNKLDSLCGQGKIKPTEDIIELKNQIKHILESIEKINKERFPLSEHTNIKSVHTATETFLGIYLNDVKDDDHLIILDTFIDDVVPEHFNENREKLFDLLERKLLEKPSIHLSLIAVAYTKNSRLQMLTRALISQEGKRHLHEAQEFWVFVVDKLLKNFPDRVSVREINFLPCFSAFAVQTKKNNNLKSLEKPPFSYKDISSDSNNASEVHLDLNISEPSDTNLDGNLREYLILTQCRDIYYSLMADGSSHQCDYFYIQCNGNGGNNSSHEKRLINYINHCWLLGTKFDTQLWMNRLEQKNDRDSTVFSNEQSDTVNKWLSLLKDT